MEIKDVIRLKSGVSFEFPQPIAALTLQRQKRRDSALNSAMKPSRLRRDETCGLRFEFNFL